MDNSKKTWLQNQLILVHQFQEFLDFRLNLILTRLYIYFYNLSSIIAFKIKLNIFELD